jgi:hypothetical protein
MIVGAAAVEIEGSFPISIIWRTSEELSKFNKRLIANHYEKSFVLELLSLFSFMGARDYVLFQIMTVVGY